METVFDMRGDGFISSTKGKYTKKEYTIFCVWVAFALAVLAGLAIYFFVVDASGVTDCEIEGDYCKSPDLTDCHYQKETLRCGDNITLWLTLGSYLQLVGCGNYDGLVVAAENHTFFVNASKVSSNAICSATLNILS